MSDSNVSVGLKGALERAEAQVEHLKSKLAAVEAERDRYQTVAMNEQAWLKWCDHKVLERAEAAESQLARAEALARAVREWQETREALTADPHNDAKHDAHMQAIAALLALQTDPKE